MRTVLSKMKVKNMYNRRKEGRKEAGKSVYRESYKK
jgi:hypothetical protein